MQSSSRMKLTLVGSFVSVFLFSFVSQAYATNLTGYPAAAQAKSNWCWAAAGVSILQYYGISVSQCSFYDHVKGTSGCATNESETYGTVQAGIHSYGVSSWNHSGALSYSDVKSQIDNLGSPVYVSWKWNTPTGGGHAVVIYGYDTYGGNDWIQHMDPGGGIKTSMVYTNFKGGSSYDRTWRWGLHGFSKYI
ncbi:C39 family peptidase [Paenibacillus graminis]|uniref:C39 family peptidase n=1 Tax=Paenibacillus graminis TaxID=189425 RepID=UPI0004B64356|nr:C39 family peptidase [Paenibacillus graminis]